jgi:hypothetical protein
LPFRDHAILIAIGIDAQGSKHVSVRAALSKSNIERDIARRER